MNTHGSDDDFAAVVAGLDVESGVREHLASCVSCRQQVAELQAFVADRRGAMEAEAPDWQLQHRRVMTRLGAGGDGAVSARRRWLRPVLAGAATFVAAVGIRLSMAPHEAAPPVSEDLAVEEILAEVDAVLADDSLPGFESIDFGVDDPAKLIENGTS